MEINCNLGRYNKSSSDYAYRSERRTPGQKEGETRTRKKTSGPPAQSEAIDTMAVRSNLYQPQRTANADEKREQGNERLQGLPHTTGHARQDEPARVFGPRGSSRHSRLDGRHFVCHQRCSAGAEARRSPET